MKDTRTFQEVFAALGQIQWKIVTVGEHLTGGPLVNACSYLKIPASEKVFAFIDQTPYGIGKAGLAIAENGLYARLPPPGWSLGLSTPVASILGLWKRHFWRWTEIQYLAFPPVTGWDTIQINEVSMDFPFSSDALKTGLKALVSLS